MNTMERGEVSGEFLLGLKIRSRAVREGATNHRQGRCCGADPSLEPGERPQRADSGRGAASPPASTRAGGTEQAPPGKRCPAAGLNSQPPGSGRPQARRGFPARLPGEARLSAKVERRKTSGGTGRGKRHAPYVPAREKCRRPRHRFPRSPRQRLDLTRRRKRGGAGAEEEL